MSAKFQFEYNFLCCLKDIYHHNWNKLKFHWSGVKRALYLD
jgi:hypothetical protein